MRTRRRLALATAMVLLALAGCSSEESDAGSDDGSASSTTSVAPAGEPDQSDTGSESGELPQFADEFSRVCTTQVGFSGAAEYVADAPGPNKIIYMEDIRDEGTWIDSSQELPEGWGPVIDSDFEDNSEFRDIELIACNDRTAVQPTGLQCDFEDDGETVTFEIVDATYTLTVYSLRTGEVVGTETIEAVEDGCPMFASYEEGDTELITQADSDAIINAVKAYVTPTP